MWDLGQVARRCARTLLALPVFYDWQNSYNWARQAFHHPDEPARRGNFDPAKLAETLADIGPTPRRVTHIGIYTGRPDPRKDPRTHGAHMRQCDAWARMCGERLSLRTRTLRYAPGVKARGEERGVDVQLAIDAMIMAVRREYDVAILATADTDLLPVIEGLQALQAAGDGPLVEVIGWRGDIAAPNGKSVRQALDVPGVPVRWTHQARVSLGARPHRLQRGRSVKVPALATALRTSGKARTR